MILRRGKMFYCRIWIPIDFRSFIGKSELKKSLRTSDRREAKALAASLIHRAETAFIRMRTGMLTPRQLEQLKAELIFEFTGKIENYREQRLPLENLYDKDFETICNNIPNIGWQINEGDFETAERTFKPLKTREDIQLLVEHYGKLIDTYEEELATGLYSDNTRWHAKRLVLSNNYEILLPHKAWFDINDDCWFIPPSPEFGQLCHSIVAAIIEGYHLELERVQGRRNTIRQERVEKFLVNAKSRPLLSDLWVGYSRDRNVRKKWTKGTAEKNTSVYERIIDILGDKELAEYSKRSAVYLIENIQKYPSNKNKLKAFRGKSFSPDMASSKSFKPLSISEINFTLELMSSMFKHALEESDFWLVRSNPFSKMQLSESKNKSELKDVYAIEDITGLFNGLNTINKVGQPERFWVPLISLFTGMRLDEVCQLRTDDVQESDGIFLFHINHKPEVLQSNKSKESRTCPVHPLLLKLGLLKYLEFQRQKKSDRLFSNLSYTESGKWCRKIDGWYNRTFEKTYTSNAKHTFHSLRHTFINYFKQNVIKNDIDLYVLQSMVGHSQDIQTVRSITMDRYGKDFELRRKFNLIKKLNYGAEHLISSHT